MKDKLDTVEKCKQVEFKDNREILRQIVVALEYLHDEKLIHRDLKPQNIFISANPALIKIGDFGVSRVGGDESLLQRSLRSGMYSQNYRPYGTHFWIGPEQYNNGKYCYLTDIFPLGCIFGFVLSGGKHPFCTTLIPKWEEVERKQVTETISLRIEIPVVLKTTDFVDIPTEQGELVLRLMKEMLNYDQTKRPTATEILKNEYFSSSATQNTVTDEWQPARSASDGRVRVGRVSDVTVSRYSNDISLTKNLSASNNEDNINFQFGITADEGSTNNSSRQPQSTTSSTKPPHVEVNTAHSTEDANCNCSDDSLDKTGKQSYSDVSRSIIFLLFIF